MDRRAWQATVHGVAELDMTEHAPSFYSIHRGKKELNVMNIYKEHP